MPCELLPRGEVHGAAAYHELEEIWMINDRLEVVLGNIIAVANNENLFSALSEGKEKKRRKKEKNDSRCDKEGAVLREDCLI